MATRLAVEIGGGQPEPGDGESSVEVRESSPSAPRQVPRVAIPLSSVGGCGDNDSARTPRAVWNLETDMVTKADLNWWLDLEPELEWQFATTYAEGAPHEYVIAGKTPGFTADDAARAAHVIRTYGEPMKFYKETRIYLVTPMGWKHWDMQGQVIIDESVTVINRGRVGHVYGIQNAPTTASGHESEYDRLATTWDRGHGMTVPEIEATASLIRATFGGRLGRTLDVGCGTGLPLDLALVEPVRYVGIDPSTAMLNALVLKHPVTAGIHPMTYAEAERRRVLCGTTYDTVFALGGSASYLAADDIERLRARAKRDLLLMHYASDELQSICGLDASSAKDSLRAATAAARARYRIGRFVATTVAGDCSASADGDGGR